MAFVYDFKFTRAVYLETISALLETHALLEPPSLVPLRLRLHLYRIAFRSNVNMGVPGGGGGGGGGRPHPPVCWANKASRAIFASQSGNIGLL